jgi:o-succinylbenzoate synthase
MTAPIPPKHDPLSISKIEIRHLKPVLTKPFTTSFGTTTVRDTVLVSLYTTDGLEAHSETASPEAPSYNEEYVGTALPILRDWLIPALRDRLHGQISSYDDLRSVLNTVKGNYFAKTGIEAAYWNLVSQQTGTPLKEILGGTTDEVLSGFSIGAKTPEDILSRAEEAVSQGFQRLKVKIWPGLDLDIVLGELRRRYPAIMLQVDANASYDPFNEDHRRQLKALDQYNLLLIEQPFDWTDMVDHVRFQAEADLKTPICLDEPIRNRGDVRRALDLWEHFGIRDRLIINIKPPRMGGYWESVQAAHLLRSRSTPGWIGGMLELAQGKWMNIILSSNPAFALPGDHLQPQPYYQRDIFTPLPRIKTDGTIEVPSVVDYCQLDWEAVDALSVERWSYGMQNA